MRFLHTADWQLGLKLRYLNPERAAQMRLLRFQMVERIAEKARDHQCDFVVVAGDVLDDNALGRDALQQTSDALRHFGNLPVFLLPGNHDAATEDCALLRLDLQQNVQVLTRRMPVPIPGGLLYPCPLMRRHERDDPTCWLPSRADGEGIRVALAHGGVIDFTESESSETPNLIDAEVVLAKGFDYLALGDWHGLFSYGPRVWYPSAPEPTRFKEKDPGQVLIVDIEEPGAIPAVAPIRVAQTVWRSQKAEFFGDDDLPGMHQSLEAIEVPSKTLLDLELLGNLSMGARDNLDRLLEEYSERLVHLRYDDSRLHTTPSEQDLAGMSGEGFIAQALDELRGGDGAADADALRLMYRLQQEVRNAAA